MSQKVYFKDLSQEDIQNMGSILGVLHYKIEFTSGQKYVYNKLNDFFSLYLYNGRDTYDKDPIGAVIALENWYKSIQDKTEQLFAENAI